MKMGGSVDGVGGFTGYRHGYGQLDFLAFSKQPTRDFSAAHMEVKPKVG